VRAGDVGPMFGAGEVHAGADHVLQAGARLSQRLADQVQAEPGLGVRAGRGSGTSWRLVFLRYILLLNASDEGEAAMSEIERQVRGWWARLMAWLRGAQHGEAAQRAKTAFGDMRTSDTGRKAESALRDLRGSDAARKAEAALRDLREGEAGRKAKEAFRDLRDSEAVGKARDAARDVLRDLREGEAGRKAKETSRDLRDSGAGRDQP